MIGGVNLVQPQFGGLVVPLALVVSARSSCSAARSAASIEQTTTAPGAFRDVTGGVRSATAVSPSPPVGDSVAGVRPVPRGQSSMRQPPVGIAVLGFFALVNGIAAAVIGLQLMGIVAFGPVSTGTGVFFSGFIAFGLGVLYVAWPTGPGISGSGHGPSGCCSAPWGSSTRSFVTFRLGHLTDGFAAALLPAVILWYLNTRRRQGSLRQGEQDAGLYASNYDREQAERIQPSARRTSRGRPRPSRRRWPRS